jgi:hypothetical protein
MRKMILRVPLALALGSLLLATPAEFQGSAAGKEAPLAVATRFARAFESQDFTTVRALFAPDAMVSRVALSQKNEPSFSNFTAKAWTDDAERNHVYLRDVRLEILESSTQKLEWGAVVSLRYRFSGKAGPRSFVSNGIDTYSLVPVDGSWRVLHYGYIERIEFF